MKKSITKMVASTMLRLPFLEHIFCTLCAQKNLRKYLHLGAFAYGYQDCLEEPKLRVAVLDTYKMYVNIAEPIGIQSYFFGVNPFEWLISTGHLEKLL